MPLNQTVRQQVRKKLIEKEEPINHLYLDSKGYVTVGIGHLIPNKPAIISLPLYTINNNLPFQSATAQQKMAEYDNIKKQKTGYVASWYKKHATLVMKDIDVSKLLDKHIDTFYRELSTAYSKSNGYGEGFDSFPVNAQAALFDMIFNLGQTRLTSKFINFNAAIKIADWTKAANESNRPDVNLDRNMYVKSLFQSIK